MSAMGDATDRIVGLELGADDYLAKPFIPRELLARIKALLRRKSSPAAGAGDDTGYSFAGFTLDVVASPAAFRRRDQRAADRRGVLAVVGLP